LLKYRFPGIIGSSVTWNFYIIVNGWALVYYSTSKSVGSTPHPQGHLGRILDRGGQGRRSIWHPHTLTYKGAMSWPIFYCVDIWKMLYCVDIWSSWGHWALVCQMPWDSRFVLDAQEGGVKDEPIFRCFAFCLQKTN
jgi:hypothetical protein